MAASYDITPAVLKLSLAFAQTLPRKTPGAKSGRTKEKTKTKGKQE